MGQDTDVVQMYKYLGWTGGYILKGNEQTLVPKEAESLQSVIQNKGDFFFYQLIVVSTVDFAVVCWEIIIRWWHQQNKLISKAGSITGCKLELVELV